MQDEQEEFRMYLNTQAHRTSIRLCNFASLITDHGPTRAIKSIKEVSYESLLTPEAVREGALINRRVRVLEQGELLESDDEDVDLP